MSDNLRILNQQEEKLLERLVSRSTKIIPSDWKTGLLVSPLQDGGMGSLALFPHNTFNEKRQFVHK